METARKRVAILGGGIAGMSAAFQLSDPSQNNKYEITLYQMGWRLGGKCASGRDSSMGERVQEHGLHVFFGFYDNAFSMLSRAYDEVAHMPEDRFKTAQDALQPHNEITVMELIDGHPDPWTIQCPVMPGFPGTDNAPTVWETVLHALEWLMGLHKQLIHAERESETVFQQVEGFFETAGQAFFGEKSEIESILIRWRELGHGISQHDHQDHRELASMLKHIHKAVIDDLGALDDLGTDLRRLFILFDFGVANLVGVFSDGLLRNPCPGLSAANQIDYRAWLRKHGAAEMSANSAIVRALYDLIFAYPGGDVRHPGNVAAGAMARGLMQLWRYRGSVLYKMRAGTGDVVATPLFKLFQQRGVNVEFFHDVKRLVPKEGQIDKIEIGRQVTLKKGPYQPLKRINNVDCWPDKPFFEQIEKTEAERLQSEKINLESRWSGWKDAETITLKNGTHFDEVVLAIPVDGLRDICAELAAENVPWSQMLDRSATVETQSVQFWLDKATGWPGPKGTLLGGYDESQLDTWADVSEILEAETWDTPKPKEASILVGPLAGPSSAPPKDQTDYPAKAREDVLRQATQFVDGPGKKLWPNLYDKGTFDYGALRANFKSSGIQRLSDQYIRANVDPSERYTLSLAGTIDSRLRSDQSGYRNLWLAGDWTENPQNMGSFEASVMSGMLAARGLSGFPKSIDRVSEKDPLMNPPLPKRPLFVDHIGEQTFPGRVSFTGVRMWSHLVRADKSKLAGILKTFFDQPSGGAFSTVPLSSHVMVSVADIAKGRFDSRPDQGWSAEKELAFWIFVGRRKEPGSDEIVSAHLFNPYLFLDNTVAILTGREVYGFQKQAGWVTVPASPEAAQLFEVDAIGAQTKGPDAEWKRRPFFRMEPFGDTPVTGKSLADLGAVGHAMADVLTAHSDFVLPSVKLIEQIVVDLVGGRLPNLFLKQFRAIDDGKFAQSQNITETDIQVTKFHSARLLGPRKMTLAPLTNLPITEVLGLETSGAVDFGIELSIDMELNPGRVLWSAES